MSVGWPTPGRAQPAVRLFMRYRWLFLTLVTACGGTQRKPQAPFVPQLPPVTLPADAPAACAHGADRIIATPEAYERYIREGLVRYTEVATPNGGVVPIFAGNALSDAQILRARELLRFFVADHPDSRWGSDKTAVANAMAANNAALVMPNGEHREGNEPRVPAQPLYDAETPVAGSDWFMDNDFDHRDAALEEIFHLVHDTGIGTWAPGALPEYQAELLAEAEAAIEDGRWGIPAEPGVEQWLQELRREDSLAQEYIASVIDSWYGLWGPWDEADGGMWGVYIAKIRAEVEAFDPAGGALLSDFLPEMLGTIEPIDPDFTGRLSLLFDAAEPYTHKTRYFSDLRLLGTGAVTLVGNAADNRVVAGPGDLAFEGGQGTDTLVVCSEAATVVISEDGRSVTGPEGQTWQLDGVESIHFLDSKVVLTVD